MEENEVIEDDLGFRTVRAPLAKFDTIESLLLRSSSEESDGEDIKSVLSVKAAPQLQISSAQRDSDSTLGTPTPTAEKSFTEHLNGDSGSRRTPTTPESAGSGASSGAGHKHSGFSKLFSKFVSPVTHGIASTFHLGKAHEAKHDKLEQSGDQNEAKSRAKTASPNVQVKSTQKKSVKRPAPPPPVVNDATANKTKIHELIRQGNIENESSSISEDDAKEKALGLVERRSSLSSESSGDTIKGTAAPPAEASTPEEEGAHGLLHQDSIEYEESVDFELLPNSSRQTTLIVRADRSKYEFESKPIERPRSATPLQPVPLDEYLKVDLRTVKSEEKLNIIIPGEEFVLDKPRAPRRQIDNKTWMNFCAQSLSPRHRSLSGPPEQYSDDASSNTIPRLPKTLPPAKTFRKRAASSPSSSSSSTPGSPEKFIEASDINVVNDTFLTGEAFGPEADGDHSSWVASFDQAVGVIPTVEVTSPPLSRSSRSSSEGSSSRRSSSSSETPTEVEKPNEEPNKHSDSGVVMCNGESQGEELQEH